MHSRLKLNMLCEGLDFQRMDEVSTSDRIGGDHIKIMKKLEAMLKRKCVSMKLVMLKRSKLGECG